MAAPNTTLTNLTSAESALYHRVFTAADKESIGVITGDVAFKFLPERTKLGGDVLGEIWQIADSDDKGFLTPAGFQTVLRLVGYAQAGRPVSAEIAKTPGPLPKFEGINGPVTNTTTQSHASASPSIAPMRPQASGEPPIRVPALTPDKATQYAALFESTTPKDELMSGGAAKTIFDKAQIPNETLVQIWNLADTEERGMLSQTEFIIAMHLIACFRARTLRALPTTLPAGFYEAASRRGAALPRSNRTSGETRQFSGSSMSSTIARPAFPAGTAKDADWAIPPAERAQYDMQFAKLDDANRGYLTGEQAAGFFKNSRLSDDDLAHIWDLSDTNSSGQLNKEEFSVALHLIRRTKNFKVSLPSTLPPNLVPPSMRSANFGAALTQSPMATGTQAQAAQPFPEVASPAPAPAVPAPPAKPSAMDDLFGLDDFSATSVPALPPAAKQVAQSTGGSSAFTAASQPPAFGAAASKPPSTTFKPFVPTSSFGQSLSTPQQTGSATGTPSRVKSVPFHEDLLSDDEATPVSNIGSDSVDIGNLSNQVNTLQTQQSGLGTQRQAAQQNLAQSNAQKRELETRLGQLRTTYEAEAREVKELEQRLQTSKADTNKARQDLAMVQHSYENLSQQRAQLNAGLELDQAENQQLKAQMNNLNQEITQLKAHSEKMQSDARQQKGLVAINRKQLTSLESERDRLRNELNTALTDHEGAIRELEETRLATQGTQSQLQDLQVSHSNKSRELEETRKASTAQRSQLDALNAQHQTLSNTLNQTHVAHQSALAEFEQLDAAHASKIQELEQLQSSYSQLQSTHQSKLQEIEQLRSSHQSKLRELEEVKRNHETKTRELEESHRQAASHKTEIAATGAAIAAAAAIPVTAAVASAQRDVVSPAASTRSATNPFFKSPVASPPTNAPQASGFDDDFFNTAFDSAEPAQAEDPVTPQRQLNGRTSTHERLPSATAIPPPPPESTQITSENLPLNKSLEPRSPTSSVGVAPPVSAFGDSPFNTPERATGASAAPRGASGLANMTNASEDGEHTEEPSSLGDSMVMVNAPEHAEPTEHTDPIEKAENDIPGAFPDEDDKKEEIENDGLYDATPIMSRTTTTMPPPVSFGTEPSDKGKERAVEQPATNAGSSRNEFPEIQEFDGDDSSDDENGFSDSFEHNKPQHLAIPASASTLAPPQGVSAVSSALPTPNAEVSPPPYEGGQGEEQFPQEYKGLLPSREPPTLSPETSTLSNEPPAPAQSIERVTSGSSLSPSQMPMPPGASSVSPFAYTHTAASPPVSTPLPVPAQEEIRPPVPPKAPVAPVKKDDFDDFEDSFAGLSEARSLDDEEEDTTQHFSNGFTDFNPAFDSPRGAHSRATTANGGDAFADFENRLSGTTNAAPVSAAQATQASQASQSHDWDAIFANLDAPVQTTYAPPSGPPPSSKPSLGRAISMGTEHDDPILKRLVGMGYPREKSLEALEKSDYNIDQALDYLAYH